MRGRVKRGVGRGFEKRVNRGPILKYYCRPKALEKQHFGKSHSYCHRFFPGNTVTIILDNYPPSTLNYCRRELLSFRRLLFTQENFGLMFVPYREPGHQGVPFGGKGAARLGGHNGAHARTCHCLPFLSATFLLSTNSRTLDVKSRQKIG